MRAVLRSRGFSVVEALIAIGLVVLALIGLFGVMPYTYRQLQDGALHVEASTAAEQYLDRVRIALQSGQPVPAATEMPLDLGRSFVTGEKNQATATLDLAVACTQPDGPSTSLFDCTVTADLKSGGSDRVLAPFESYVTRQNP